MKLLSWLIEVALFFVLLVLLIGSTNTLLAQLIVSTVLFPIQDSYCGIHIGITHAAESTIREDRGSSILSTLASTPADKARLLSTSAPYASSWLLITQATGLDLYLDPNGLQTAVKWWLGVDTYTARETPALYVKIQHLTSSAITPPLASKGEMRSLATII